MKEQFSARTRSRPQQISGALDRPVLLRDSQGYIRGECIQAVLDWLQSIKPGFRCPEFYICSARADGLDVEKVWASLKRKVERVYGDWSIVGTMVNLGNVHWAALVICRGDRAVEYYDPFGTPPQPKVRELLEVLALRVGRNNGNGAPFGVRVNKAQHQTSLTECGLHSLVFVYRRSMNKRWFDCTAGSSGSMKALQAWSKVIFSGEALFNE
ncbi:hypothetical protein KFL_005520030 [Klebsormidium nitens]|uniref:Ubiquitin-like protease family profile domain-containing protein n=1 Tax=Klebsormidium nitens TaxID=105231 RepID=A0A1Y1ILP2_KLENI|nr:hypothetical protein KFL_005520030 [Klebsormidium nitens]|eukprot:GAQ89696.1 hypothetical protein KFL_005520030 [Klebsormidium nitens]